MLSGSGRARSVALLLTFSMLLSLALSACGGSSAAPRSTGAGGNVVVATLTPQSGFSGDTASQTPSGDPPVGGKLSSPATLEPGAPTPVPAVVNDPSRPTSGHWIDVDVTKYQVQLMDGANVLQTVSPVAVGAQINTGAYESTQTGLFHVYVKTPGLQFDAPYNTYISDWVGFDPDRANGFHSFLLDAQGKVVNASTGKISNGCIRTGQSKAIYDFAEIGMPVYVHL
jgi:hypothetical protein